MDDLDREWVNAFIGSDKSIPDGAIVEGFISVISWIDEAGNRKHRHYNTIDAPLSHIIGLLDIAKYELLRSAEITN